jgi:DNA-binding transcriptional ArsR family regulator
VAATHNPVRSTPSRPGGLVRPGLTTAQPPTVELDPRTAYDFLTSACADCGELEDLLPEDRGWIVEGRAAIIAELGGGTAAQACAGFASELSHLIAVRPEIKNARDTVAAADGLGDAELLGYMLQDLVESQEFGAQTRSAMDGDKAAWHALAGQLQSNKGHAILPESIDELAPTARRVLHAWLPLYEKVEERVARMIASDVATKRRDDAITDPLGFVERATNGIRLVPEPAIRTIVLAPSYFGRPYNSLSKVGDIQLVCYPIADAALGASGRAAPPVATVRLYRALGDESRLRILQLLAERDRYLTELATELDLSKPTVSHHLAQLRSASLVTMTEQGNLTYYSLRRDRIEEAGPELRAFLAR